jgi:hypothetical protein
VATLHRYRFRIIEGEGLACIATVGTIAAAGIANWDKLFGRKDDPTAISVFQEEKYNEVIGELDSQASALEEYRDHGFRTSGFSRAANRASESTNDHLSQAQIAAISLYLQSNKNTRRTVEDKHRQLLAAVGAGDNLKSMTLKTEINQVLTQDIQGFTSLTKDLRIYWPRRQIAYEYQTTVKIYSPTPTPSQSP